MLVQQLPYKVSINVSRPVGRRCDGGTVRFDTGLLDSHEYLGINADRGSRVQLQMTTTYVPMNISDTLQDSDDPYINMRYADDFFLLRTFMGPYGDMNFTYELPTYQSVKEIPYQVQ